MVGTGGLLLYSQYEEYKVSQEVALFVPPPQVYLTPTPLPTRAPTATAVPQVFILPDGAASLAPTPRPPTETPVPATFTATPVVIPSRGTPGRVVHWAGHESG